MDEPSPAAAADRALLTVELLAIGTELTVGETTDTNSGELARSLVAHGVAVTRVTDLPDHQPTVVDALLVALTRADLVVCTGGLGPTPDDLTREAVAEACGEALETSIRGRWHWLKEMWARRNQPFPEVEPQAGVDHRRPRQRSPTSTAPRRAGGSIARTAASSSCCRARPARWSRCGGTSPCRGSSAGAWAATPTSGRCA